MSVQHKQLADGRWNEMSLAEQMANIGGEVERALNWRLKNNADYCQRAFERALELIDLSLENTASLARLKELTRLRECLVDYFWGANEFQSNESLLRKYFLPFVFACRRHC